MPAPIMWRKGFIVVPRVREEGREIVMGDGVPGEHGGRTMESVTVAGQFLPSLPPSLLCRIIGCRFAVEPNENNTKDRQKATDRQGGLHIRRPLAQKGGGFKRYPIYRHIYPVL